MTEPLTLAAAAFFERKIWHRYGYARLEDHARERFQRTGRWLRDLAAIGRAMTRLPRFREALSGTDGKPPLTLVSARIVAATATPETIDFWIERARSCSVRGLREEVAAQRDRPAVRHERPTAQGIGNPAQADSAASACLLDEASDLRQIRLRMPEPACAAFDEGFDLFRAIEGRETSVTSYIEAMVAECAASAWLDDSALRDGFAANEAIDPDGAARSGAHRGPSAPIARREMMLERSTGNWKTLRADAGDEAGPTLRAIFSAGGSATDSAASMVNPDDDQRLMALLGLRQTLERRLDEVLAWMGVMRAWSTLEFASLEHYAEERLGMSRTSARDRARLMRGLDRLPELRCAYEQGEIGIMAALEIVRLLAGEPHATAETRRAWVERARRATVKRLRDEVRALRRADAEMSMARDTGWDVDINRGWPELEGGLAGEIPLAPQHLSVSESASRGAAFGGNRRQPSPMTDAEWHASLARRTGDARARVARLAAHARDMAASGRHPAMRTLALRLPADLAAAFLGAISYAARTTSAGRVGAIGSLAADAGARTTSAGAGAAGWTPPWQGLLALVEEFVHTWDVDHSYQRPARIAIYVRDGWRCMAPGCTSRRHLEDHHVRYRAHGGGDGHDNRVCLCRFHHQRGEHGELARVRGRAPLALRWSLGQGGRGGAFRNEIRIFDSLC